MIKAWVVVASFLTVVDAVKSVPAYFVFGDSLLDVGENNYVPNAEYHANFPPYGETFFHRPTGRFSNGRNLGDFFGAWLLTLFWNNSVASDLKMRDGWGQISSLARDFFMASRLPLVQSSWDIAENSIPILNGIGNFKLLQNVFDSSSGRENLSFLYSRYNLRKLLHCSSSVSVALRSSILATQRNIQQGDKLRFWRKWDP